MSLEVGRKRIRWALLFAYATVIFASTQTNGKVTVSCNDTGGGIVEIRYGVFGEQSLVRAFALDITVSSGATIESVYDYKVGHSTLVDPGYGIFPSRFREFIDPENPNWNDPDYNPLALPGDPGALPGLGTYGITIEMGSLYSGAENAPLASDTLLRFAVDLHGRPWANVELSLNEFRGGIVLENGSSASDIDLTGCIITPEPATILLLGLGTAILKRKK